jgi:excisionase family DNA binding protein
MVMVNQNNRMLTVAEVAELLSLHINTVRRWSNQGIIKSYRIGPRGDRRFQLGDLERFLNHHPGNAGIITM